MIKGTRLLKGCVWPTGRQSCWSDVELKCWFGMPCVSCAQLPDTRRFITSPSQHLQSILPLQPVSPPTSECPCYSFSAGAGWKGNVSQLFWTVGADLRLGARPRAPPVEKMRVLRWSLHLTHSLTDSLSSSCLHFLSPAVFLCIFLLSLCLASALPPRQNIWVSFRNQPVTVNTGGEEGKGGRDRKLWLCASAVIFFITEPALTQIMECTGSLSERQRGESGPLPTLGYANPSAAVWV